MLSQKPAYNFVNKLSALLMIVTLLWLTISAPYVAASEQAGEAYVESTDGHTDIPNMPDVPDAEDSPFGNTTEEKTEASGNTFSEYLTQFEELSQLAGLANGNRCIHKFDIYVAFHGELLTPPPIS